LNHKQKRGGPSGQPCCVPSAERKSAHPSPIASFAPGPRRALHGVAVSRCRGVLGCCPTKRQGPDAGARVSESSGRGVAGLDSAWMRAFPGLDLSPCFSPLVTKPLRTSSFSVYEVWATVPLPRLGQNKLEIGYVGVAPLTSPLTDIHLPPQPRGAGGRSARPEVRAGAAPGPVGLRAGTRADSQAGRRKAPPKRNLGGGGIRRSSGI
jgi:hypothetical protein